MKRALLIVAVFVMANVALAGDCVNGTCQPVRNVAKVVKGGIWLPTVQTVEKKSEVKEVTVEKKTTTTKTYRTKLLKRFRLFR